LFGSEPTLADRHQHNHHAANRIKTLKLKRIRGRPHINLYNARHG